MVKKEGRRVQRLVVEVAGTGGGSGVEDESGGYEVRLLVSCYVVLLTGSTMQTSGGFNGLIRRISSARSNSSLDCPTRTNSMQSSGSDGQRQVSGHSQFIQR